MQRMLKVKLPALAPIAVIVLLWAASAQQPASVPDPLVKAGITEKISPHVYVIPDQNVGAVPNVGIVVGSKATLVVDPGMGRASGEVVLGEVRKVSRNPVLYVVSTHFHPEHTTGGMAFPAGTKFPRARLQQQDIDELGAGFLDYFRKRSSGTAKLLEGAEYPRATEIYDHEKTIDLGGVTVRLTQLGPSHTRGDNSIWIEPDRILFAGDVVMNMFPAFLAPYSSGEAWLQNLDRLEALHPAKIVPSHGPMGDASMISRYRRYLSSLEMRVRELKQQGKSEDEASKLLTEEFKAKYPEWPASGRIAGAVQAFWSEVR